MREREKVKGREGRLGREGEGGGRERERGREREIHCVFGHYHNTSIHIYNT